MMAITQSNSTNVKAPAWQRDFALVMLIKGLAKSMPCKFTTEIK